MARSDRTPSPTRLERAAAYRAAERARAKLRDDIERLCADAGISIAALARSAGVPYAHLWRIMAGRSNASLETYAKLAAPLGADLATRLYPNTGPAIRDRHQGPILEHLLEIRAQRWLPFTEVGVMRPARGWIDVVLADREAGLLVAVEIESDLRRIEQTVRWSREKAESLPSWQGWHAIAVEGRSSISQLLVVRRTRSNVRIGTEFSHQLSAAYPAHPEDAIRALTGAAHWPGAALVWATIEPGRVRLVPTRYLQPRPTSGW